MQEPATKVALKILTSWYLYPCTVLPYNVSGFLGWSVWLREYISSDRKWLSKVGHECYCYFYLGSTTLGKARPHENMRTLKWSYMEVHRQGTEAPTNSQQQLVSCVSEPSWKQKLQPQLLLADGQMSPGLYLGCKSSAISRTISWTAQLLTQKLWDNKCLLLF